MRVFLFFVALVRLGTVGAALIVQPWRRPSLRNIPLVRMSVMDTALSMFDAAVAHDANNATAYRDLGVAAKRLRHLPMAANSLRRAIELLPRDVSLKLELGETFVLMGYVAEAEAVYDDVLLMASATSQQSRQAKLARANLLLDGRGQRAEALATFQWACEQGPSPMAVLAGVACDSIGDHTSAMGYYTSSHEEDRFDEDAALHLMLSHMRAGDAERAADLRRLLPTHVVSSVDYVLAVPEVAMKPSMHYFTFDMVALAVESTARSGLDDGLVLEFGVYAA